MIVNKTNVLAIFQTLSAVFNKAFQNTETVWKEVAMLSPSTKQPWLLRSPAAGRTAARNASHPGNTLARPQNDCATTQQRQQTHRLMPDHRSSI